MRDDAIFSSSHAPSSTTSRRAVSVITITRSASWQSAVSTCSWCGVGAESTVCSVTTSGCASSRANDSTYSPSRPPKIPYSCCSSTTSTSSAPALAPRGRSHRARPARWSGGSPAAAGSTARRRRRALCTSSTLGDVEQRRPHVERERANPACARWVRREDRGTHVSCAPFARYVRYPMCRSRSAGSIGFEEPP